MISHRYNQVDNGVLIQLVDQTGYLILNCSVEAYEQGMKDYQSGALIQNAFPFLSPGEREFLLSGLSEDQFDELFEEI